MAHQYVQQANQVLVSKAKRNWFNNNEESNMFGLEPNFGCCTANMHQGWPKFVKSLWYRESDSEVVSMVFAPCRLETEAEGKKLKPKQAVELRKMGKEITKEAVEGVLACKEKKKPQSVSVKLPVELYEKYFAQMDAGAVQEIMEKALEGYFGKEAAGV